MIKKYTIDIYPHIALKDYIGEVALNLGVLDIGLLVLMLINKMLINDTFAAIVFLSFPVCIFLIYLLNVFIFTKVKISIDYINDKFIKRGIFKTKTYELKDIKIKKEFYYLSNPTIQTSAMLVFYYNNKVIFKANAEGFEKETNHNSDDVLQ